jgi:hypothetical protein
MYSIIELVDKGYKIRFFSENLEDIYKHYKYLLSIYEIRSIKKRLIIFDYKKNDIITFDQLKFRFEKNTSRYIHTLNVMILFIVLVFLYLLLYR